MLIGLQILCVDVPLVKLVGTGDRFLNESKSLSEWRPFIYSEVSDNKTFESIFEIILILITFKQ